MLKIEVPNLDLELSKESQYRDMTVDEPKDFLGREFSEEGINSVASCCSIPGGYLKKVYESDKDLFRSNVEYWSKATDFFAKYKMIVKGEMVAGFCKTSHQLISTERILNEITNVFTKNNWDGKVEKLAISPKDSFVNVVFEGLSIDAAAGEPKRGDLLNAGFSLSHSMLGVYADKMTAYVSRLVCSNGMIAHDDRLGWKKELDETYSNYFPLLGEYMGRAFDTGQGTLEKFAELKRIPVTDPIKSISSMGDKMGIGAKATNSILQQLNSPDVKVENLYDVMNLFTFYSTHVIDDPYLTRRLQSRVGDLMESTLCDHCHQVIKRLKISN